MDCKQFLKTLKEKDTFYEVYENMSGNRSIIKYTVNKILKTKIKATNKKGEIVEIPFDEKNKYGYIKPLSHFYKGDEEELKKIHNEIVQEKIIYKFLKIKPEKYDNTIIQAINEFLIRLDAKKD